MSRKDHPMARRKRNYRDFYPGDNNDYSPRRKYRRSDRHQSSRRAPIRDRFNRLSNSNTSHVTGQRTVAHSPSSARQSVPVFERNKMISAIKRHSRVYVGNLPVVLQLPDDAYKELFTALYVTAFGSLKVGEVTPVDSFWMHKCGIYGFLQMKGPKEAVNVMLFNGLILNGKKLTLSRPTGYLPELKNLKAEEYIPDHVNADRMEALVRAMGGILSTPIEGAYIIATQQVKRNNLREMDRKTSSACSEHERQRRSYGIADNTAKGGKENGLSDKAIGKVVVMVDVAKTFNLEDKIQYEELLLDVGEECSNFGDVNDVVIPKKGSWVGSVFVEFGSTADARKTVAEMRKRGFEKRPIEAYVLDKCETVGEALGTKRIRMNPQRLNVNFDR